MTAAAPSGVVTFLFTDVEGSTRRWEADAEAMRAAFAAHDHACATRSIPTAVVLFKHTGDGVCAAFASPRSAVDAAVAAQRALKCRRGWGGDRRSRAARRGLFRCGAESGRARDGRRSPRTGPADRFHGGLLSGVELVDLGPRRLRDLPTPVRGVPGPSTWPAHGLSLVAGAGLNLEHAPPR